MTHKDMLKKWQKLLGLTDWVISLQDNCLPADFILDNARGECEYNTTHKAARIRIIRPDLCTDKVMPFDYEKTLIHELLHIKFALIDDSGNDIHDRIIHQLVDDFAKLLCKLGGGKNG